MRFRTIAARAAVPLATVALVGSALAASSASGAALASPARSAVPATTHLGALYSTTRSVFAPSCTDGIYVGYTGTQENESDQYVGAGIFGTLSASEHPSASGDCFNWFRYDGGSSFIAELMSNGNPTGKVLASQGSHVILREKSASVPQSEQWTPATETAGYAWSTGAGTGVLTASPRGTLSMSPITAGPEAGQEWNFTS